MDIKQKILTLELLINHYDSPLYYDLSEVCNYSNSLKYLNLNELIIKQTELQNLI